MDSAALYIICGNFMAENRENQRDKGFDHIFISIFENKVYCYLIPHKNQNSTHPSRYSQDSKEKVPKIVQGARTPHE